MAESQREEAQIPAEPPQDAGSRLRAAREAKGLTRGDIAAVTKIPERHIAAIEAGDFAALAGRSYALGFSRTYARAVGLDDREIVEAIRREMADADAEPDHRTAFEPGDPSRVPGQRLAWLAALIALAAVVSVLILARGQLDPAADLAEIAPVATDPPATAAVEPTLAAEPVEVPSLGPGSIPVIVGVPAAGGAALPPPAEPAARAAGLAAPDTVEPLPGAISAPVATEAPVAAPAQGGPADAPSADETSTDSE